MANKLLPILRIVAIILIIITAIAYYLSFEYAWIFALIALLIMAFFVLPESIKNARKKD
jgi:hypothetical protein